MKLPARLLVIQFALVFLPLAGWSETNPNPAQYETTNGGYGQIEDGAIVEGSTRHGGIQPDYTVNLNEEPLKTLMETAAKIGKDKSLGFWDKVGAVRSLVRGDFFIYYEYYNPYYRRLLKKYRDKGEKVPLAEYGVCGAGVCREYAMVFHFALKAAGIPNDHAYAHIYRASNWEGFEHWEDHAFNVVKYRNQKWVVDAFYWGFNGYLLSDLMSEKGITEHSKTAPIADPGPGSRRIIHINDFPVVYNPKVPLCRNVFH
ncbi:transglutaminase domain-containing protein [Bdellovibrio sp. HCB290]|uniref:transglutaminase domain-containing protein n=1 Tax=Bdellovibrio sp. HCB290 TaxID=3394356 RepID=UPI0039B6CE23